MEGGGGELYYIIIEAFLGFNFAVTSFLNGHLARTKESNIESLKSVYSKYPYHWEIIREVEDVLPVPPPPY